MSAYGRTTRLYATHTCQTTDREVKPCTVLNAHRHRHILVYVHRGAAQQLLVLRQEEDGDGEERMDKTTMERSSPRPEMNVERMLHSRGLHTHPPGGHQDGGT